MRSMLTIEGACFHRDHRFGIPASHPIIGGYLDTEIHQDQHGVVLIGVWRYGTGLIASIFHDDCLMSLGEVEKAVGPDYTVQEILLAEPKGYNGDTPDKILAGTTAVLRRAKE